MDSKNILDQDLSAIIGVCQIIEKGMAFPPEGVLKKTSLRALRIYGLLTYEGKKASDIVIDYKNRYQESIGLERVITLLSSLQQHGAPIACNKEQVDGKGRFINFWLKTE